MQGTATIDFGATPGTNTASVTVTGQSGILSGSLVEAFLMADTTVSGSAGHNEPEHQLLAGKVGLTCGEVIAGTGFTIHAVSELRLTSTIQVRWVWN